jgi:hypothetical protein
MSRVDQGSEGWAKEIPDKPGGRLRVSDARRGTIAAPRMEHALPIAYRLVRDCADNGSTDLRLQGCFRWQQGFEGGGTEWRDIETLSAHDLANDRPFGPLL